VHQIGRCDAPGCDRSARATLEVVGAGARTVGLVCPKHAAHTELGALLLGRTVSQPPRRTRA
jgi:hypothetical protein